MSRHIANGLVVLGLMALPVAAVANPLDAFGFGAEAVALGGAVTATTSDVSANYYNPAGLALGDSLQLDLGYIYVDPMLTINDEDLDVDRTYGMQGGLVLPGRIGSRAVAVSVGLYVPAERITRIRALNQTQPRWTLYDNRMQRLVITSSAAIEIVPNLYAGFGMTFLSDTRGSLDLNGYVDFNNAESTGLLSAVDVNLESVRYASAGLMFTPGNWHFGLSFRDEFSLDLELGVNVIADIFLVPINENSPPTASGELSVVVSEEVLFSPRQLVAGAAYMGEGFHVAFDLAWLQWSHFPAPAATIDLSLDLSFDLPLALPDVSIPEDPDFHDIIIPRIGAEFRLLDAPHTEIVGRLGYFFESSPAPDQPGITNYIDAAKHGMSLGFGFTFTEFSSVFPGPVSIDLAALYMRTPERAYAKSDPSDIIGSYYASGQFVGGAVTFSFLFP